MVEEEVGIAIVGGGICGLATALALHRKSCEGVVVLEAATLVRREGTAIAIYTNGWRALHQLGVDSTLRSTTLPIHTLQEISLDDGSIQKIPVGNEELRCVRRCDLIEALANSLPSEMLRFGCQVVAVKLDHQTRRPIIELQDGSIIKAKVVIGCDGANSVVAAYIGLKSPKFYSTCSIIGFTNHPNGHNFENESIRMRRGNFSVGRFPVNDKLVYWFIANEWTTTTTLDSNAAKNVQLIKQLAVKFVEGFPTEIVEMVEKCDLNSLLFTRLRYRPPWDILFGGFKKGSVCVTGDAMHVMGPFLGQGGSVALEDAVVLARCLLAHNNNTSYDMILTEVEAAFDKFIKERKKRLVLLSAQTHVIGLLSEPSPSVLVRFVCVALLIIFFRRSLGHTLYDCGRL